MSITITATVGGSSSNSFITEVEYIAYTATRLNLYDDATVSGSTCTETEKKAMIEATRELTLLPYVGTRVTSSQALAWPRADAINPDAPFIDSVSGSISAEFSETEIPKRIKDACCEYAIQFLKAGTTDIAQGEGDDAIKREKVGPIEVEYQDSSSADEGLALYPRVLNYVRPLLSSKSGGLEMVRM